MLWHSASLVCVGQWSNIWEQPHAGCSGPAWGADAPQAGAAHRAHRACLLCGRWVVSTCVAGNMWTRHDLACMKHGVAVLCCPATLNPETLKHWLQAQQIRTRLMVHMRRIFYEQGVDFIATPTTGVTAPLIQCVRCSLLLLLLTPLNAACPSTLCTTSPAGSESLLVESCSSPLISLTKVVRCSHLVCRQCMMWQGLMCEVLPGRRPVLARAARTRWRTGRLTWRRRASSCASPSPPTWPASLRSPFPSATPPAVGSTLLTRALPVAG